jgi:D-alanine-D-alanine ligase
MNVAVLYSLPTHRAQSSDFVVTDTDTEDSAKKIYKALHPDTSVRLYPIREDTIQSIKTIHADVFINCIEWDGLDLPLTLQAFDVIESSGIPYAGATKKNYEVTTDKLLMKKAFDDHALPTAPWQLFLTGRETVKKDFRYPVIVKLSQTHCSVGLDQDAIVVDDKILQSRVQERIHTFHQPVIAEEFIQGREFQVTMLEHESGLTMLPPAEIRFDIEGRNRFLTFASRWTAGDPDYKTSHIGLAVLDPEFEHQMKKVCERAFTELGFRDYARFDIRSRLENNKNTIFFLETNSNPGLDDSDEYGMTISYKAVGMTFKDFLLEIIASALRRVH